MAQNTNPKATIFQHLTYDNYYLTMQRNDLQQTINTLEANISELNRFIRSQYDLSFNVSNNITLMTMDGSGNILSCLHSDMSGNFMPCFHMHNDHLPSVVNPVTKFSKTHISDSDRYFHYPYSPHYPHYPHSPYYPPYYGGYPYYSPLYGYGDNYYNRDVDIDQLQSPIQPPNTPVPQIPSIPPIHPVQHQMYPIHRLPIRRPLLHRDY